MLKPNRYERLENHYNLLPQELQTKEAQKVMAEMVNDCALQSHWQLHRNPASETQVAVA